MKIVINYYRQHILIIKYTRSSAGRSFRLISEWSQVRVLPRVPQIITTLYIHTACSYYGYRQIFAKKRGMSFPIPLPGLVFGLVFIFTEPKPGFVSVQKTLHFKHNLSFVHSFFHRVVVMTTFDSLDELRHSVFQKRKNYKKKKKNGKPILLTLYAIIYFQWSLYLRTFT